MRSSIVVCAGRWPAVLCLIGAMLGCGSGSGRPADTNTDSDDTSTPDETPGNLPNLSTHSGDVPAQEQPAEPADCAVLDLSDCVTAALDELSSCLAAGHGGEMASDLSSCSLAEANATVAFDRAVPRWSTPPLLSFSIQIAGEICARYVEHDEGGPIPEIALTTGHHQVTFTMGSDNQSTLLCNDASASFQQSQLSGCREPKPMPTPELTDQIRDGFYEVAPRLQSNRRVFNCQFPSSSP